MGYEFHVPAVTLAVEGKVPTASVELENRGVAPFYYDWPAEFALLSAEGKPQHTVAGSGKLTGLLPGEPARVWTEKFPLEAVRPGRYHLALCVPNPMPGGKPLRFANKTQDQHCPGWLTLGAVVVP